MAETLSGPLLRAVRGRPKMLCFASVISEREVPLHRGSRSPPNDLIR
jgi:hypothetical protein